MPPLNFPSTTVSTNRQSKLTTKLIFKEERKVVLKLGIKCCLVLDKNRLDFNDEQRNKLSVMGKKEL